MRKLLIIGLGAGDPAYLTLAAVAALWAADVFFVPDKGEEKSDLKQVRLDAIVRHARPRHHRIVEIAMPPRQPAPVDYDATVSAWHARIADAYEHAFAQCGADETGGLLVWGDPSLYDSTLRILDALRARGVALDVEVIPGISAVQALCARHRIPLNRIGAPVVLTTGRQLAAGWPDSADTIVVLLDGEAAFAHLEPDEAYEIFWGAYLGTPDECLIAGPLHATKAAILAARREARARKGWIMDTYLLRRTTTL